MEGRWKFDPASPGVKWIAFAEIFSVVSSVVISEWVLLATASGNKLLLSIPAALALGYIVFSQWAHKESARELGWRMDNFVYCARLLMPPMLIVAIALVIIGWLGGGLNPHARSGWSFVTARLNGFLWALLQQYALQAFINRRAQAVWGPGARSVLLVGLLFALLHLPNPALVLATFIGGIVWASVYQRAPNLYALAVSHSIMAWALISTLPISALHGLRVGYRYLG